MAVYFDYNLYETEKYSRLHSILEWDVHLVLVPSGWQKSMRSSLYYYSSEATST